jgi:membrane protease YdiL (CAAX protease family)
MLKRLLLIWFVANLLIVGLACALMGRWYLSYPPLIALSIELALVMVPNLILPIWALGRPWFRPQSTRRESLGWRWPGNRALVWALGAFAAIFAADILITRLVGNPIPYNLPGSGGPIQVSGLPSALGLTVLLVLFVGLTVASEETMFRGFVQGQASIAYGPFAGVALSSLLFGLRHLPADIFYAHAWSSPPSMWLSRELQLYTAALGLAIARLGGRSTFASAITHALLLATALFGL